VSISAGEKYKNHERWFTLSSTLTVARCCLSSPVTVRDFFYRATICAMRGFCYRPVSVCLSVHTAEDIVQRFSRPRSSIILVFDPERRYPTPRETPSTGALNGVVKCRLKSPFISETVRDRPMVTMKCSQEVIGSGSMCVGSDDLEWPWKAGRERSFFSPDLLNNARSYRLT